MGGFVVGELSSECRWGRVFGVDGVAGRFGDEVLVLRGLRLYVLGRYLGFRRFISTGSRF